MCPTSTPAQTSSVRIESNVQLLVEGRDLEGFCEGLTNHLGLQNLQIQNFGGVNQLRTFLPALTKMSDFSRVTSIGIVRDAERDAAAALQSVQRCIEHAELSVSTAPAQRIGDDPTITVMILPGDNQPGMLETLLCDTFIEEDVCSCINTFFDCVEEHQGRSVRKPYKARARAYLATKPDPHLSIGVAAKRRYWDLDHPVLQPLRVFLRRVAVDG